MPQNRTLLFADDRLHVERVTLHATPPQWSPVYVAPSTRLVLPLGDAAMEYRGDPGAGSAWVDAVTALCVPAAQAYQLRPDACRQRESVVVSAPDGDASAWSEVPARLLAPRTLFRLRLHWRRLAAGLEPAGATALLIEDMVAGGGHARSDGAVGRARRFLATQPLSSPHSTSMRDIADAACSSSFHLARMFRRDTGWSLHQYRQHLQLATALARLDDGERDLAGLAHDLGFCSQSHFGALFAREVGLTPARARMALCSADRDTARS